MLISDFRVEGTIAMATMTLNLSDREMDALTALADVPTGTEQVQLAGIR